MALKKGDVVLVPIPFTDQSQSKVRPSVILSDKPYNTTKPDVILGAITTNLKGRMMAVRGLRFGRLEESKSTVSVCVQANFVHD